MIPAEIMNDNTNAELVIPTTNQIKIIYMRNDVKQSTIINRPNSIDDVMKLIASRGGSDLVSLEEVIPYTSPYSAKGVEVSYTDSFQKVRRKRKVYNPDANAE